jgi:hypothetical protein
LFFPESETVGTGPLHVQQRCVTHLSVGRREVDVVKNRGRVVLGVALVLAALLVPGRSLVLAEEGPVVADPPLAEGTEATCAPTTDESCAIDLDSSASPSGSLAEESPSAPTGPGAAEQPGSHDPQQPEDGPSPTEDAAVPVVADPVLAEPTPLPRPSVEAPSVAAPAPAASPFAKPAGPLTSARRVRAAPAAASVTPGAFCKRTDGGQVDQTATGQAMVCSRVPGDASFRWRSPSTPNLIDQPSGVPVQTTVAPTTVAPTVPPASVPAVTVPPVTVAPVLPPTTQTAQVQGATAQRVGQLPRTGHDSATLAALASVMLLAGLVLLSMSAGVDRAGGRSRGGFTVCYVDGLGRCAQRRVTGSSRNSMR